MPILPVNLEKTRRTSVFFRTIPPHPTLTIFQVVAIISRTCCRDEGTYLARGTLIADGNSSDEDPLPAQEASSKPILTISDPYQRGIILRGTILNRAYGKLKNPYSYLVLITIFGPIYYGPP